MAGDTPGWACPPDDVGMRPQMSPVRMSDDRLPATNIRVATWGRGEGRRPSLVLPGALFW